MLWCIHRWFVEGQSVSPVREEGPSILRQIPPAKGKLVNVNDDLIAEFLIECHENLDQLDRDLVALEKAPQNREHLASIFRTVHTIKGTCGFFSFPTLQTVTHAGETLLSRLRDGQLQLNEEITNALL